MTERKWTKGPWVVGPDPEDCKNPKISIHLDCGDYYIAQVDEGDEQIANAHLIAAAPELLDALSFVADCLDLGCSKAGREIAVGMARAAIAKAKGITK